MSVSAASQWFPARRRQLLFALRATTAAFTGYVLALALHLECPYWAAMTALIVIQPTRGLLFEKSLYRLVGTATGALAGLVLLSTSQSPAVLTVALALWVGGCVGIGNLLFSMRSYACMMAGMTCTIVAMSGFLNPPHLYAIAFGRIGDVLIGIVAATLVTALFTPRQSRDEIVGRLETVTAETVRWLALVLEHGRHGHVIDAEQNLVIEIAEIEGQLERIGAGSLRFKKHKRRYQQLIARQLSLMTLGRNIATLLQQKGKSGHSESHGPIRLRQHLNQVADKISRFETIHCLDEMTATVREITEELPSIGIMLNDVVTALHDVLSHSGHIHRVSTPHIPSRRHLSRNRHEALRAALRATLAIGVVGLVWTLFDWRQGPMMLMAMSIMLSIFSTKEHPVSFVGQIFIGAAIGSALAVGYRLLILPEVQTAVVAGLVLCPMIFLGTYAMSCRRTAIGATDATLFFIFICQPGPPVTVVPAEIALAALAMVLGVGSAWLSYRFLVPINPLLRLRSLLRATNRDLQRMSTADRLRCDRLQARIHHRVIRMVALANQYDRNHSLLLEAGLAALAAGTCVQCSSNDHPADTLSRRPEESATPSLPPREEALALFHAATNQWFQHHQLSTH
nr:FUSC family protein [uncultured Desulfuromonas sp.]